MGNNSILDNISEDDFYNEIRLCLSTYSLTKTGCGIIVEGPSDAKLLKKLLTNTDIIQSFAGKQVIKQALERFPNEPCLIAICDRDYEQNNIDHMFFYDYNCMELMLLNDQTVLNALLSEYPLTIDMSSNDIFKFILHELKPLSVLRKINYNNHFNLNISYSNVIFNESKSMNLDVLIDCIRKRNNGKWSDEIYDIFQSELRVPWKDSDYLFYTQGHDFFIYYAFLYADEYNKNYKPVYLEKSVRMAFNNNSFEKTNLYHQLEEYSYDYGLSILRQVYV